MSTDHQRYSIDNQAHVLAKYADAEGLTVVRTYSDAGRSGLTIEHRDGLTQLIADVRAGADFEILLVYDVSRWGRFQDTDESAYYEFVCRRHGVRIVYVAEPFENDGAPMSAIVKSIKRVMAAEYSRELGRKVFLGQSRLAEKGYWVGGPAPYGYRRCAVSEDGSRRLLRDGELKSFITDRIILTLGPPEEASVVRRIFAYYVSDRLTTGEIADRLRSENAPRRGSGKWWHSSVALILRSPVYTGDLCRNTRTKSLTRKLRPVPRGDWTVAIDAVEPIVSRAIFAAAQKVAATRRSPILENEEVVRRLKALLDEKGYLSCKLIASTPHMPTVSTLAYRFGGITEAFAQVGFAAKRSESRAPEGRSLAHAVRKRVRDEIMTELHARHIRFNCPNLLALEVAGQIVRILTLAPQPHLKRWHTASWIEPSGLNVFVRLAEDYSIIDYFIVPGERLRRRGFLLTRKREAEFIWYRADTLEPLFQRLEFADSQVKTQPAHTSPKGRRPRPNRRHLAPRVAEGPVKTR